MDDISKIILPCYTIFEVHIKYFKIQKVSIVVMQFTIVKYF